MRFRFDTPQRPRYVLPKLRRFTAVKPAVGETPPKENMKTLAFSKFSTILILPLWLMAARSSPVQAATVSGADVYQGHCAACHDQGLNQAPPKDALQKMSAARPENNGLWSDDGNCLPFNARRARRSSEVSGNREGRYRSSTCGFLSGRAARDVGAKRRGLEWMERFALEHPLPNSRAGRPDGGKCRPLR